MIFQKSITAQIALMMVLISLVPLLGVAWHLNDQKSQEIWESQTNNLNLLYRKSVEQIETSIQYQKDLVRNMAENPRLIAEFETLLAGGEISKNFDGHLSRLIQRGHYHDFLMLSPDGDIFYTTLKESDLGRNIHSRAFRHTSLAFAFERTSMLLETEISPLRYYAPSDRTAVFITTPIISDRRFLGVLAIQLNEEYLYSLVNSNEGFGRSGEIVTGELRDDGAIVATIPLRYDPQAVLNRRVLGTLAGTNGLAAGAKGEYGIGLVTDYRDIKTLAVWGYVPSLRWAIMVKTDQEELYAPLERNNQQLILLLAGVAVLIALAILYSSRIITRPIMALVNSVQRFSRGDKRRILPVRSKNEIGLLGMEFHSMSKEIDHQMNTLQEQAVSLEEQAATLEEQADEIERHNATLEEQVKERTAQLDERNKQVTALLDNSGQGFLSFGPDRLVDAEYSKECESIFDREIARADIADLLLPDQGAKHDSLIKTLELFFASKIPFQRECLLSLLPAEATVGRMIIQIAYREIAPKHLMAILTDITQRRELERQIEEDRTLLGFITMVLRNKGQFFDTLDECKSYLKSTQNSISREGGLTHSNATKLYRKIHTFKGVFLQFTMPHLPKALHGLESHIWAQMIKAQETPDQLVSLEIESLAGCFEAISQDRSHLSQTLGASFLSSKSEVTIPGVYLETLETLAHKIKAWVAPEKIDDETRKGLEIIQRLRYTPLKALLSMYPNLCNQLATRLHKEIEPFEIEGGDLLVDPKSYGGFTKALVHIFRNAVDHGIEEPHKRREAKKSEVAKISCRIEQKGGEVTIEVRDDGRGLDTEVIATRAANLGLIGADDAAKMTQQQIFEIIFLDGFSTKADISDLSGRGVGLSALKGEVSQLGGRIEIESLKGEGSRFRFIFPNVV